MRPFEKAIEDACAKQEIPGAVLLASDRTGDFSYSRCFGKRSVRDGADQSPLQLDTVMWIASCTKVVTSIAALQCCERGLLSLDGPVYDILPEFRSKPVITGVDDDGKPILVPHTETITLRHLLNHSSGIAYDEVHPKLLAWHEHNGTKPNRAETVAGRFDYPLVFEPGASWFYGAGVDWAGVMVERANSGMSLQQYCDENIFHRAYARDIVFSPYLATRPAMAARRADMSKRDPDAPDRVKRSNARLQWNESGGCFGGLGLFATPQAFFNVVHALLDTDHTGTLLMTRTVDEFFRGCLSPAAKKALNNMHRIKEVRDGMGGIPEDVEKDWGLGGIVNVADVPGGRTAGSMTWGGLPNLTWFVDRKAGLCGFYAGQVLPPGDAKVAELCYQFELGLYEMYNKRHSKL